MALGRPRKTTTVHGDVRWEVDCTPLSGKRHREYFAAKKEADERQREVNRSLAAFREAVQDALRDADTKRP